MSFWNGVTPQSVNEASNGFVEFRIGANNAFIKSVCEKTAKESGNPMLEITFANEDGAEIKHYIVDDEYKLSKLKQLYAAFGIPPQDYTVLSRWINKEGIVVCKQGEPYNGNVFNKVSYLKPKNPVVKPETYPAIKEDNQPQTDFDDDIPF
jgi:hypothetical protein